MNSYKNKVYDDNNILNLPKTKFTWGKSSPSNVAYQKRIDTSVEKKRDIEAANEKIDMLKADIQKYTSDAARLTKEIAGHDEDISREWNNCSHFFDPASASITKPSASRRPE